MGGFELLGVLAIVIGIIGLVLVMKGHKKS